MIRYFTTLKSEGEIRETRSDKLAEYFSFIEQLTGLDRAMAELILRSGQAIDHPVFEFHSSMRGSLQLAEGGK